ncbi:FHA domain-containing protein [Paenibacillus soyae]|uniref:FHA domain-containing protein n=1 Tax=Paenibacillus soyae TaxID=2969249 RepID=A0A9X2MMH1_9BACL|nr:FHA domain-containing protein [Paenibacillus soyae]MCR2802351.1 FHA domain-containing protein [Paenibacillus soyae]
MQQFRIDFAMNRGHEMMIDKESGMDRSELDELELQVLSAQQVPYLLPMDWYEVDGKVTFRYSLSGTKMLVHRLQQEPLSMEQYYGLLLTVTDAILECKDYMLRPEGCLLNEQLLFMGERLTDIRIAYMPLKHPGANALSSAESLLALAVRWTTYIETIDGAGLKRIVQLLNQSRSPLSDLRDTLLELIAGGLPPAVDVDVDETYGRTANKEEGQSESVYHPPIEQPKKMSAEETLRHRNAELELDEDEPEFGNEGTRRRTWAAIAAAVIAAACAWRFLYAASPSKENLLICSAVTLVIAAGLLLYMRKSASLLMERREMAAHDDTLEPYSEPLPAAQKKWRAAYGRDEAIIPHGTTTSMGSYSVSPPRAEQANSPAQTAVLEARETREAKSEEETALLSDKRRSIRLCRKWNGQEEEIALDGEVFKIGRSGDGVSYTENAEGISRLHLEIERIGAEHHAKDLGSRNGSLLNGKLMVPYKTYKLESGDRIQLAGDKGPLYELQTG